MVLPPELRHHGLLPQSSLSLSLSHMAEQNHKHVRVHILLVQSVVGQRDCKIHLSGQWNMMFGRLKKNAVEASHHLTSKVSWIDFHCLVARVRKLSD